MADGGLQAAVAPEDTSHHRCGSRWACVRTHPKAEHWANANLQRQGYQTYLPMVMTRRRDRTLPSMHHNVLTPLFAGYLFTQLTPTEPWHPINSTYGVQKLLTAGGKVVYARAGAVEALQASEGLRRCIPPPDALWRPGAACRLAHGPFQGLDGVVMDITRDSAVVALLMLGQLRNVAVNIDVLERRDGN